MNARLAVFLVVMVTLAGVAAADEVELQKPVPPAWGTVNWTELNLHSFEFVPIKSDTTYDFSNWMKYVTGGYPALTAGVHLPAGAKVQMIMIAGCDDSAANDFHLAFWQCPLGSSACIGAAPYIFSAGTGCNFWSSGSLSVTIDNGANSYFLEFNPTVLTIEHRFRDVEIYYTLQVSPAPAMATFADVPVGAFGFQHIEALAASGITGGCGGGNFCPNDPLTRAQMAVFLAKALGLHWPW